MRASSAFIFECGITTSSCPACSPLRMRVRKSAIGSVIDIAGLPARLLHARDEALVRDLAQADAAQPELAVVRTGTTAALAAVVVARRILVRTRLLDDLRGLGHYSLLSESSRVAPPSPSPSPSSGSGSGFAYASGF